MERVMVSACLLGVNCRYNAKPAGNERITEEAVKRGWIPVCPEQLGGLTTPRAPSELRDGRIISSEGEDVTEYFEKGAAEVLRLAELYGVRYACMKERSPSCGFGTVYDGSFSGRLVEGNGVCARLLSANGIKVFGESELERMLRAVAGE